MQEAGLETASVLVFVTFVGAMFIVGDVAHGLGHRRSRRLCTAAAIGPFAIPLLYLFAATSAVRKLMSSQNS
jgi:Na+-driven multidrug efflux pump